MELEKAAESWQKHSFKILVQVKVFWGIYAFVIAIIIPWKYFCFMYYLTILYITFRVKLPSTECCLLSDAIYNLLQFAAAHLVLNGRLVYWLPSHRGTYVPFQTKFLYGIWHFWNFKIPCNTFSIFFPFFHYFLLSGLRWNTFQHTCVWSYCLLVNKFYQEMSRDILLQWRKLKNQR